MTTLNFTASRTNGGADVKVSGHHTGGKPLDITIELGKRVPPAGNFGPLNPPILTTIQNVAGGTNVSHTFTNVPAEAGAARISTSESPPTVVLESILSGASVGL